MNSQLVKMSKKELSAVRGRNNEFMPAPLCGGKNNGFNSISRNRNTPEEISLLTND